MSVDDDGHEEHARGCSMLQYWLGGVVLVVFMLALVMFVVGGVGC